MMAASNPYERVVESLRKTAEKGQRALRLFNHPEWHNALQAILNAVEAIREKHGESPRPSVADDYLHLAMAISQFHWPDEELEDDGADQRLDELKGIMGMIRIDVDRVTRICAEAGGGPSYAEEVLPSGTTMLPKPENPGLLRAVEKRLERIEIALMRDIKIHQGLDTSVSQQKLVDYFVRSMRCDVSVARASLLTGPNVDLGVLERAGISMLDVTGRMIATISSKFSQATSELRTAVVRIREPVWRFATGVHTFLKYVIRANATSSTDELLSDDQHADDIGPRGGELLREARERLKLSFEDVARVSRVGTKFLEALEKEDFSVFSAEHYIIGFGKSYARAVGESEPGIAALLRRDLKRADFKPQRMKDVLWTSDPTESRTYHGPLTLAVDAKPKKRPPPPLPKKEEDSA